MISVLVPVFDIDIIFLDTMLFLSDVVIIFQQGISLELSELAEAPKNPPCIYSLTPLLSLLTLSW